jgi:hypothetical protein
VFNSILHLIVCNALLCVFSALQFLSVLAGEVQALVCLGVTQIAIRNRHFQLSDFLGHSVGGELANRYAAVGLKFSL